MEIYIAAVLRHYRSIFAGWLQDGRPQRHGRRFERGFFFVPQESDFPLPRCTATQADWLQTSPAAYFGDNGSRPVEEPPRDRAALL